jgi:hypothetical protein
MEKVEQGEKLNRFPLHSIGILNFDINLAGAAVGEIFMILWVGDILKRNFMLLYVIQF